MPNTNYDFANPFWRLVFAATIFGGHQGVNIVAEMAFEQVIGKDISVAEYFTVPCLILALYVALDLKNSTYRDLIIAMYRFTILAVSILAAFNTADRLRHGS